MKAFAVLALVALTGAHALFSPYSTQYHAQDGLGGYTYGYDGGPSAKQEVRSFDGVTRGGYSYLDAHGLIQSASYVSDPVHGFRVAATNLPVGPAVPAVHRFRRSLAWPYSVWHYGPAPLNADGTVRDTPEVMAAKAVHYAAHANARMGTHLPLVYAPHIIHTGAAPLHLDGRVADTPEVTAAKIAHFAAHAEAAHRHRRSAAYAYGPAPLNADGTVAETPEVRAAKAVHFAAHADAAARAAVPMVYAPYVYGPLYGAHSEGLLRYGPAPLNPDGTVRDTAEVAAAKAHHFSMVSHALSRARRSAPLNPDGTVADTHEVRAAKAVHFAAQAQARGFLPYTAHYGYVPAVVDDTPDVKAAKVAHFAAHAAARGYPYGYYPFYPYYYGAAPLHPDGTVADTPEVAAAKIAHFAAHHEAAARTVLAH